MAPKEDALSKAEKAELSAFFVKRHGEKTDDKVCQKSIAKRINLFLRNSLTKYSTNTLSSSNSGKQTICVAELLEHRIIVRFLFFCRVLGKRIKDTILR